MALPPLAPVVFRRMDPRDRLDVYVALLEGNALRDILQPGEEVVDFWIDLPADSYAAGVRLEGGDHVPRYADRVFVFVLTVDPARRGLPIFDSPGYIAAVEVTFTTNLSDREKQYTVLIRVVNK